MNLNGISEPFEEGLDMEYSQIEEQYESIGMDLVDVLSDDTSFTNDIIAFINEPDTDFSHMSIREQY